MARGTWVETRRRADAAWLSAVWTVLLLGCGASDPPVARIAIVTPADAATITLEDDEDDAQSGVQVTVIAETAAVGPLAALALQLDDENVAISSADRDGNVVFSGVTLLPGEHSLRVRTINGSVQSVPHSYLLVGLEITDPLAGATLTGSDDEDPGAEGLQRSVQVRTYGVDLDATITLHIDGEESASLEATADGEVVFARQTLSPGTHELQAFAGDVASEPITVEVNELCPTLSVVVPELSAGQAITLGPRDDELGPSCGQEFAVSLAISTSAADATDVTLLVNGTSRATVAVSGTVARFDTIVLGNRGALPNRFAFELEHAGATCRYDVDSDVFVDCEGVSCSISSPMAGYLNQDDDTSDAPGFQGTFRVTTDLSVVSESVTLIVDGNALDFRTATPVPLGASAVAQFAVDLGEGPHHLLALCNDPSGNITVSGQTHWTVDTTPCAVSVMSPRAGAFVLETDDVDSAEGTQINVMASLTGSDCDRARAALCSGLEGMPLLPISGPTNASRVTLSTAQSQEICFEARDTAGNVTIARTPIFFDSDAPMLSIRTPTHGARVNVQGNSFNGASYLADLNTVTPACDVTFDVLCSDLETDVTLHEHVSQQAIVGATAPCDAAAQPSPGFPGVAHFASVAMPRLGTVALHARQVAAGGRLTGISTPITLIEDCEAPVLMISSGDDPLCGAELGPALNAPSGSTITRDIEVTSDDAVGVSSMRLQVVPEDGGFPIADILDDSAPFEFNDVNFSALGSHDIVLVARDQAGNAGSAPQCRVSVVDAPALTVEIAEDADPDAVIESEDDCGTAPGLQIAVSGTTDAPQGAAVTIVVSGTSHTTAVTCSSGTCRYIACVDAPQGQVTVRVQVDDPTKPTAGVIERQVVIDSAPPQASITDFSAEVPSNAITRDGHVLFHWTDVADVGGITLDRYELRCATTEIVNENGWLEATPVPINAEPESAGSQRSATVGGFALYQARHCVLRAFDVAGAATPLADDDNALVDFVALRSVTLDGAQDAALGGAIAAVGDVNHDGVDDVLVGGSGRVQLRLGALSNISTLRSVTISGPSASFGATVVGLGDINDDGVADVAIGEPDSAAVYVFLGRDEQEDGGPNQWPALLDATLDASLVLRSDDDEDRFGAALAGLGDVNDDGIGDFAIGAPLHADSGRVHVVLGAPLCSTELTEHCLLLGSTTTLGNSGGSVDGFVLHDDDANIVGLGTHLSGLGDVNDDGHNDLLVSATGTADDETDASLITWGGIDYAGNDSGMVAIPWETTHGAMLGGAASDGPRMAVVRVERALQLVIAYPNEVSMFTLLDPLDDLALQLQTHVTNDLGDVTDNFGDSIGSGALPALPHIDCDVDADQDDELWLGASGRGGAPGSHDLYFASTLERERDTNQSVLRSRADFSARSSTGPRVVACIGDINGDGASDLAAGDPAHDGGAGRVTFFY